MDEDDDRRGDEAGPSTNQPPSNASISRAQTQAASTVATINGVDDNSMEDVLDKLKILEYESNFSLFRNFCPLNRTYFSAPAVNPNEQFYYFTSLVAWLMELLGNRFQAPSQFDDPNASATLIISELRKMDFSTKEIGPGRLRAGHGDAVLHVLTLLLDRVLVNRGFVFRAPEFPTDHYDDELEIDGAAADGATQDKEGGGGSVAEDDVSDDEDEGDGWLGSSNKGAVSDPLSDPAVAPIVPQVNAEEWRLEVERVGPLLKLTRRADHRDWRSHLDWIASLLKTIDKIFPEVKTNLERMAEDIAKDVEKIRKREQSLVSSFETGIDQYRAQKKEYSAIAEKYKTTTEEVNKLSTELNTVSEALDSLKTEISQREESVSDATPLAKIKEAMAKIRQETREMELRIGILQHTVLHHRIQHANQSAHGKKSISATESGDSANAGDGVHTIEIGGYPAIQGAAGATVGGWNYGGYETYGGYAAVDGSDILNPSLLR